MPLGLGALEEGELNLITYFFRFKMKKKNIFLEGKIFLEVIYLGRGGVVPSPKIVLKPSHNIWEAVKESLIGSTVSEIHRYRQTDRYTKTLFLYYIACSLKNSAIL